MDTCPFCGIIFARYRPPKKRPAPALKWEPRIAVLGIFSMARLANYYDRIGRMLKAGMPLREIMTTAAEGRAMKEHAETALAYVERGAKLSEALVLAGWGQPAFVWAHIRAGERSGNLPEMLAKVSEALLTRRKQLINSLFNFRTLWLAGMMMVGIVAVSMTSGLWKISEETAVSSGAVLKILFSSAIPVFLGMAATALITVGSLIWFIIYGRDWLTRQVPPLETLRLRMPITSQVLICETLIRWLELLITLIEAGLPLPEALELAEADIEMPQWRKHFARIRDAVLKGQTLAAGIEQVPHLPAGLVAEFKVIERTGGWGEALRPRVEGLRDQVQRLRTTQNAVITGALFVIGVIMALMVVMRILGGYVNMLNSI